MNDTITITHQTNTMNLLVIWLAY